LNIKLRRYIVANLMACPHEYLIRDTIFHLPGRSLGRV
jgi:hypothetical protein